jgi:hypothetical protein
MRFLESRFRRAVNGRAVRPELKRGAKMAKKFGALPLRFLFAILLAGLLATTLVADDEIDQKPILYGSSQPGDAVASLWNRISNGKVELEYTEEHGHLVALLESLDIPISSQVLVFSKTSFQPRRISPKTPRALYFNDEVYVGWVQGSDVFEISAADPLLGANFYTAKSVKSQPLKFERQTHECLQCHASSQTFNVPGHIIRSVFPDETGQPIFRAGTYRTDHTSPLKERWGGWYVSGSHGKQRHLGNAVATDAENPRDLDTEAGANRQDLSSSFDTKPYLSPHSDIVALMVLEHQARLHNEMTVASYATRKALHYQEVMNEALERPQGYVSDSTKARIARYARRVVEVMLYAGETRLTDPLSGTSKFAEEFAARGPFDEEGRSLRQFDLKTRIFRHPCSYLIYGDTFNQLPDALLLPVYRELHNVLTADETEEAFSHLSREDRRAILEILRATKQDLPDDWRGS